MLKGIDIRQRVEFVSTQDTSEPKTIFVLKPLTSLEQMEFIGIPSGSMDSILYYLTKSIVEIKNYSTQDIKEAINSISPIVLGELTQEINKLNNISGGEAKNS